MSDGQLKHCRLTGRRDYAVGEEVVLPFAEDGTSGTGDISFWRVVSIERHWHEAIASILVVAFERPHLGLT